MKSTKGVKVDEALSESLEIASRDEAGTQARQEFGMGLAAALRAGGQLLWIGGAMIGPDRADGTSPFEFGDDAVVGLATVMQMAGEIVSGAILLLNDGNRYAAAALTRQLVEVEYLAWAFAEDEEEAKKWMRSSKEERQRFWRPVHLRERAGGRFRGTDYGEHCGKGGHPSPEGIYLLPDHYAPEASATLWRCDMTIHANSVWSYSVAAANRLGKGDLLDSMKEAGALSEAEARWRDTDPFLDVLDEACRRQARRRGSLTSILAGMRAESGRANPYGSEGSKINCTLARYLVSKGEPNQPGGGGYCGLGDRSRARVGIEGRSGCDGVCGRWCSADRRRCFLLSRAQGIPRWR